MRKEGWRGRQQTFLLDLDAGKFDPELETAEASQPPSPIKENNVNGEGATNGSASVPAVTEESKPEEDMQFNVEAEEDGGDADASRVETNGKNHDDNRRQPRGEEVSVAPEGNQVMIRTIPPDIGRVKLEDVRQQFLLCMRVVLIVSWKAIRTVPDFMYLALGDPLQKRNYYRAGWLRFEDSADMTVVMSQLSEKKVCSVHLCIGCHTHILPHRSKGSDYTLLIISAHLSPGFALRPNVLVSRSA